MYLFIIVLTGMLSIFISERSSCIGMHWTG
jgi:hypothetical protein